MIRGFILSLGEAILYQSFYEFFRTMWVSFTFFGFYFWGFLLFFLLQCRLVYGWSVCQGFEASVAQSQSSLERPVSVVGAVFHEALHHWQVVTEAETSKYVNTCWKRVRTPNQLFSSSDTAPMGLKWHTWLLRLMYVPVFPLCVRRWSGRIVGVGCGKPQVDFIQSHFPARVLDQGPTD